MKISIIGMGYVGLTTGVCIADMGNEVICVDIIKEKVDMVNDCIPPIYEKGLDELLKRNVGKRLFATTNINDIKNSHIIFICVGTPSNENKAIDLTFIKNTAVEVGKLLKDFENYAVVAVKSTVIPGTTDNVVIPLLEEFSGKKACVDFGVCMVPEFLREGKAIEDFKNPDRIVIGEADKKSGDLVHELFKEFKCPIIRTNLRTAEMIKYASNAFLATKISFINEIANICEIYGIDVKEVANGMGLDRRIGMHFLNAGMGFGGSCFPKDVLALIAIAKEKNYEPKLLEEVINLNERQKLWPFRTASKIMDLKNKKIALLGLAFKPETDDMRDAPSISIITAFLNSNSIIYAYDPKAINNSKKIFGNKINYCKNVDEALKDADICVIATKWDEFKDIYDKFKLMKNKIVIDGRRILNPEKCLKNGIKYYGVGYKSIESKTNFINETKNFCNNSSKK